MIMAMRRGTFIDVVGVDVIDDGNTGKLPRKDITPALNMLRQHAERHNAKLFNRRVVCHNPGTISLEFDMHERR
jgi:GTPase